VREDHEGKRKNDQPVFNLRELPVLRGKFLGMPPAFDAQAIFANLAEKERIKGHHSPEGRTIRTLSRALSGWSAGGLSRRDVIVLCDQAIEDWLNARLGGSLWSARSVDALVPRALGARLITQAEAERLLQFHHVRVSDIQGTDAQVSETLEFCIDLIDKRW
jgi:hypothetical protein